MLLLAGTRRWGQVVRQFLGRYTSSAICTRQQPIPRATNASVTFQYHVAFPTLRFPSPSSSPSPSASLLVLFPSHPHFHRPTPSISPSSLASHTCILHSHLVGAPRDSCVRGGM